MEEEKVDPKWEGEASAELKGPATPQEVWDLLQDFGNLHKWIPTIDTCYLVDHHEGVIRYCASTTSSSSGEVQSTTTWAKEKLIMIDPTKRRLSYQVTDNNIGFRSYVATMEALPINDEKTGCKIKWSFVCDPVQGWAYEDLVSYIDSSLNLMANNMEDHILKSM